MHAQWFIAIVPRSKAQSNSTQTRILSRTELFSSPVSQWDLKGSGALRLSSAIYIGEPWQRTFLFSFLLGVIGALQEDEFFNQPSFSSTGGSITHGWSRPMHMLQVSRPQQLFLLRKGLSLKNVGFGSLKTGWLPGSATRAEDFVGAAQDIRSSKTPSSKSLQKASVLYTLYDWSSRSTSRDPEQLQPSWWHQWNQLGLLTPPTKLWHHWSDQTPPSGPSFGGGIQVSMGSCYYLHL